MSDVLRLCDSSIAVRNLYMHLEPKQVIGSLVISPDLYEAYNLYDFIYENYAGIAKVEELTEITDHIDDLYKVIHEKIIRHIKRANVNDAYMLHKWLDDATVIVGAVDRKPEDYPNTFHSGFETSF